MKKLTLIASLIAACGFAGLAQAAAAGTVNFNGRLVATTCEVSIDDQGADANINLPTIGIGQLTQAGMTAGKTPFSMKLSNCLLSDAASVAAYFEAGPTVDIATGRLKNFSGTADNVDLIIYSGTSGTAIVKAAKRPAVYNRIVGNSVTMPYSVAYYATDATKAGTVRSSVVYSLTYR